MSIIHLFQYHHRHHHHQHSETKGIFDESSREEYMKPGFENFEKFGNVKPSIDIDLDGEIYADQLHSLLQRISPELEQMRAKVLPSLASQSTPSNKTEPKRKLTDEDRVLDLIHCIDEEEKKRDDVRSNKNHENREFGPLPPNFRIPHYGGAFEGVISGPKTQRQTFSYQIIRKPEGTFTTKTVIDPKGNTETTIKRTINGKTETQTLVNGVDVNGKNVIADPGITTTTTTSTTEAKQSDWIIDPGRYFYVNKDGYALPKNLW